MATIHMDRQYPLIAMVELTAANAGADPVELGLPVGALVTAVNVAVGTAFDGTATATITDGTTAFVDGADLATAGNKAGTGAPKFYPTGGRLTVTVAGAPTTGRAHALVEYVVAGRGGELQG